MVLTFSPREDNFLKWELAPTSKTHIPISYWMDKNTSMTKHKHLMLSSPLFPMASSDDYEIVLNKVFDIFNKVPGGNASNTRDQIFTPFWPT